MPKHVERMPAPSEYTKQLRRFRRAVRAAQDFADKVREDFGVTYKPLERALYTIDVNEDMYNPKIHYSKKIKEKE